VLPPHADCSAPTFDGATFGLLPPNRASQLEQPLKSRDPMAGSQDVHGLTLAIRRGDPNAFSRFYDLYSFRLYRFLLVLAHGDENEAREVCQAVLIKLARRFEVFDEEPALWAWLSTLAKNAFIDHYRAEQRRNKLVSLETLPAGFGVETDSEHQLSEILRDALTTLIPEERELIQAAYVDEQPLQELAEASGLTYKAVESRLARLRQKLKKHLLRNLRHESEP